MICGPTVRGLRSRNGHWPDPRQARHGYQPSDNNGYGAPCLSVCRWAGWAGPTQPGSLGRKRSTHCNDVCLSNLGSQQIPGHDPQLTLAHAVCMTCGAMTRECWAFPGAFISMRLSACLSWTVRACDPSTTARP